MMIGITDTVTSEHRLRQYIDWIHRDSPELKTRVLSYKRNNLTALGECSGLVLTGGGDVDPILYGGDPCHPALRGVDRARDDFELDAVGTALSGGVPILGICRGLQLANVYFGGTLEADLSPALRPRHQSDNDEGIRHRVAITPDSHLARLCGGTDGVVNSSHHQAAAAVGKGLRIVARSDDGVPEALERDGSRNGSYVLLVQWHPERMMDNDNPLTHKILRHFLVELEKISPTYIDKE